MASVYWLWIGFIMNVNLNTMKIKVKFKKEGNSSPAKGMTHERFSIVRSLIAHIEEIKLIIWVPFIPLSWAALWLLSEPQAGLFIVLLFISCLLATGFLNLLKLLKKED